MSQMQNETIVSLPENAIKTKKRRNNVSKKLYIFLLRHKNIIL